MRDSLAAARLAGDTVLAVPVTTAAAPPQHYVDTDCIEDVGYTVCYTYDELNAYTVHHPDT